MKILVVEDEPPVRELLDVVLSANGYEVVAAGAPREALVMFERQHPDLVILDLGLGAGEDDGFTLISEMRRRAKTPLMVLSGRKNPRDKVRALDLGAEDYVTKPYHKDELVARVRARLRAGGATEGKWRIGDIELDESTSWVTVQGRPIGLTPVEFNLLRALMRGQEDVVPIEQLHREVWGGEEPPNKTQRLRSAIYSLRLKLGDTGRQPRLVHSMRGRGYLLKPVGTRVGAYH